MIMGYLNQNTLSHNTKAYDLTTKVNYLTTNVIAAQGRRRKMEGIETMR
jgi:hypothetical protein